MQVLDYDNHDETVKYASCIGSQLLPKLNHDNHIHINPIKED